MCEFLLCFLSHHGKSCDYATTACSPLVRGPCFNFSNHFTGEFLFSLNAFEVLCEELDPHEVLCGPLHLPPRLRMTGRFRRGVRWGRSPASHPSILFPICFLFSDHTRARFWEAASRVPSTCPSCGIVLIRGCDCHLQCGLHNFSFKHSFFRSSAYFGGPFSSFFPFRSLRYMHVCLSGRKQRKCVRDKDLTLFFSVSSQKGLETMKFS